MIWCERFVDSRDEDKKVTAQTLDEDLREQFCNYACMNSITVKHLN